jgi:N-methylhydantoinase A
MESGEFEARYEMRYRGQAFELSVAGPLEPDPAELAEAFAAEHEARYGFRDIEGEVEVVDVAVSAVARSARPGLSAPPAGAPARSRRRARFGGEWTEAAVLRGEPPAGLEADGPCVFELPEATLVVPPGWAATVDRHGAVVAERHA